MTDVKRRYRVKAHNQVPNDRGIMIETPMTLNFRRGYTLSVVHNQIVSLTDGEYASFPNYFDAVNEVNAITPPPVVMTEAEKIKATQKSLMFDITDDTLDSITDAVAEQTINEKLAVVETPIVETEPVIKPEPIKTRVMTARESFYAGASDMSVKRKKLNEKVLNDWSNDDISAELISLGLEAIGSRKVRVKKILNFIAESEN